MQMVQIEPFDLLFREITLIHSVLNPVTHARATRLIATGRIRIDPLISRVIPLAQAADAISNPARKNDVKGVVRP